MTANKWLSRRDFPNFYQDCSPFPRDAIVLVYNYYGDSKIAIAGSLWWGFELDLGEVGEGVISRALRLDKPKK